MIELDSEKLMFSKLFPKMHHLTCTGTQSLSLVAILHHITYNVHLCKSNYAF